MSMAANLLLIILSINVFIFIFNYGSDPECHGCSLIFSTAKAVATGDYVPVLYSLARNSWLFGILIGLVGIASYLTGANPLTGGGGYGSVLVLQIIAISLFATLGLMPDFSTMGFPSMATGGYPIAELINLFFGGMIVVCVMDMFKGG